jgi:hypothetical protein
MNDNEEKYYLIEILEEFYLQQIIADKYLIERKLYDFINKKLFSLSIDMNEILYELKIDIDNTYKVNFNINPLNDYTKHILFSSKKQIIRELKIKSLNL